MTMASLSSTVSNVDDIPASNEKPTSTQVRRHPDDNKSEKWRPDHPASQGHRDRSMTSSRVDEGATEDGALVVDIDVTAKATVTTPTRRRRQERKDDVNVAASTSVLWLPTPGCRAAWLSKSLSVNDVRLSNVASKPPANSACDEETNVLLSNDSSRKLTPLRKQCQCLTSLSISHSPASTSSSTSSTSPSTTSPSTSTTQNSSKTTKKQKPSLRSLICSFSMLSLALAMMLSGCTFSLYAPFFPTAAEARGVPAATVGLNFGFYQLVLFALSPVLARYAASSALSLEYMIISGLILDGGATALFGLLQLTPARMLTAYVALCFAVRAVQAVGSVFTVTAAFALAVTRRPRDVALIYGLLETGNGLGFMIGPPLAAQLQLLPYYLDYDFEAPCLTIPFVVIGGMEVLLAAILGPSLLKNLGKAPACVEGNRKLCEKCYLPLAIDNTDVCEAKTKQAADVYDTSAWRRRFLFNKRVLLLFVCETLLGTAFNFLDPTLAPYLEGASVAPGVVSPMKLSPTMLSAVFCSQSLAYVIACFVIGRFIDRKPGAVPYVIVACAAIVGTTSLVLLAPPVDLVDPSMLIADTSLASVTWKTNWFVAKTFTATIVMYFGLGAMLIPLAKSFEMVASADVGLDTTRSDVNALISTTYNSAWFLGGFLGPSLAGWAVNSLGFPWASAVMMTSLCYIIALGAAASAILRLRSRDEGQPREKSNTQPQSV